MNTAITPYIFKESVIRTLNEGDQILFCAKDVCCALGIENNRDAMSSLRASEKITVGNADGNPRAGIAHEMTYVTEPGLYRLIFKSRKAEAQVFQDWVCEEVLPAIRRTGSYNRGHQAYLYLIKDQIALGVSPDLAAKMAGKLCPAAAPARKNEFAHENFLHPKSIMDPCDALLASMKEEHPYTSTELLPLVPQGHRIHSMKPGRGQVSALGKLLAEYVKNGYLKCNHVGSRTTYTRPKVVISING